MRSLAKIRGTPRFVDRAPPELVPLRRGEVRGAISSSSRSERALLGGDLLESRSDDASSDSSDASGIEDQGRTREILQLRVVWKDGRPDTSVEVKLFRAAYPLIAKGIREGKDYGTIADELNAAGYLNSAMKPWTRYAVGAAARAMGLGTGWPRHRPDDSAA